ncbi:hypothetical protein L0F63_000236 [Massospora cicadina]|nr:hypothetical protein L0F63_000236 [Massospora cicadina]
MFAISHAQSPHNAFDNREHTLDLNTLTSLNPSLESSATDLRREHPSPSESEPKSTSLETGLKKKGPSSCDSCRLRKAKCDLEKPTCKMPKPRA